jgi:diguanylate cyclase (GGDEF)-like protein
MALGVLATSLAAAGEIEVACALIVDHLAAERSYKPSLYLERGGRLRCIAARTYLQVFDGMPLGAGMIGRTFVSGETSLIEDVEANEHYLEISPGVRAEICVPVKADGAVVGVISVESFSVLDTGDVRRVEDCAQVLGTRLAELGGGLRETPAQRLVRHATRLTDTKSRRRVEREVLEAAADVAGMDSAVLLAHGPDGEVAVVDAVGPLGLRLDEAPAEALGTVVRFVEGGTSCFTVGESGGQDFSGLAALRDLGACALAMLELSGTPPRVLLVADSTPHEIATETIELLELLCAHAASALRVADLVRDLRVQATTDPLTGLGHHRAFHARLNAPGGDRATAVIVVDLDRFKAVNDSQGHVAGDRLLREVAAVMQSAVRDADDVFRIGGDEFAVLAEAADGGEAREIANRVVTAVRERTATTASIGVCLSEPHERLDQALLRADNALYAAKAAGRDRAVLAYPGH